MSTSRKARGYSAQTKRPASGVGWTGPSSPRKHRTPVRTRHRRSWLHKRSAQTGRPAAPPARATSSSSILKRRARPRTSSVGSAPGAFCAGDAFLGGRRPRRDRLECATSGSHKQQGVAFPSALCQPSLDTRIRGTRGGGATARQAGKATCQIKFRWLQKPTKEGTDGPEGVRGRRRDDEVRE